MQYLSVDLRPTLACKRGVVLTPRLNEYCLWTAYSRSYLHESAGKVRPTFVHIPPVGRSLQSGLPTITHRPTAGILDVASVLVAEKDVHDHDETVPRSQSPELLAGRE